MFFYAFLSIYTYILRVSLSHINPSLMYVNLTPNL